MGSKEPSQGVFSRNLSKEPSRGAFPRSPLEEPFQRALSRSLSKEPSRGAFPRSPLEEPFQGTFSRSLPIKLDMIFFFLKNWLQTYKDGWETDTGTWSLENYCLSFR